MPVSILCVPGLFSLLKSPHCASVSIHKNGEKMKYIRLITIMAILMGCAAQQDITQFENNKPKLVCVAKHEAVKEDFLKALNEGFENNETETKVVRGVYELKHGMYNPTIYTDEVANCDAIAFYVANWHWDLATYMRYANIWVTDTAMSKKLAQATYTTGNGLDKFINAKEKVLEMVNQMYGSIPSE